MNHTDKMLIELDKLSRTFNLFLPSENNLTQIPLELISQNYIGSYNNYPDPDLKEQEEGEIVIGKIISFEKNILIISRIMSTNIDLIYQADQLRFKDSDERDLLTSIEIKKSNTFREFLTTIYHSTRVILTESICSRLIENGITLNQPLTIRSNLNIVKKNIPQEEPPKPQIIILASPVDSGDSNLGEEDIESPYPVQ